MEKLSLETFKEQLGRICPDFERQSFLLAISGGVDSMVLLDLCRQLKLNISVAHINYKLRKEASNYDAELVESTCEKYEIPFYLYEAQENEKKGNIQLWARELRYDFFRKIQSEYGINWLMTAHHSNDNAETFFINLLRGTGIKGLCGIPENENSCLRPLLHFSKSDIYLYAKEKKVSFREDESNGKKIYTRNKIRHDIVNKLEEISPDFLMNFNKTIGFFKDYKNVIESLSKEKLNEISIEKEGVISILKSKLYNLPDILKYEILHSFGMKNNTEIEKVFTSSTGAIFHTENYRILINRDEILISNKENKGDESIFINENESSIYYINTERNRNTIWTFDAERIQFPIEIRTRKEGDIFYPKGMKGKKKVSKFLKDEKISRFDKEKSKIICDASGDILGVFPYRQDGRKSYDEGKSILKIEIHF